MATTNILAQQPVAPPGKNTLPAEMPGDSVKGLPVFTRTTCKSYNITYQQLYDRLPARRQGQPTSAAPSKSPLLRVHGNVLYDLNYRSNIDTPYAEKNVYQHTIQTWLDITVKDNYPFRVYFTTRFSNSSLFRNFSDLNLLYNANDFNNRVKRQVHSLLEKAAGMDSLTRLKGLLNIKQRKYDSLFNWLQSPDRQQQIIAEREKRWLKHRYDSLQQLLKLRRDTGSTATTVMPDLSRLGSYKFGRGAQASSSHSREEQDSIPHYKERYDSARKNLDSLKAELDSLQQKFQALKGLQAKNDQDLNKDINGISSGKELKEKLQTLHISDTSLPKGYQTLYSIRSFGIGRTMLDYSELSAKNISITGLQVEYNPGNYMAVAAGTVDYRFRDYTVQNPAKGQYIGLVRYGWGKKDGNNLIFTYYTGKRQMYNAYTDSAGSKIPNYSLMGFTVEGNYKLNCNNMLTAEAAKSSSPYYSLDSSKPHNTLNSALKMNDHSNEAWSLKLNSFFPATQTQVNATYRRFGANFQSFSIFTSGSGQHAWSVKVDQPFFKRHLLVTGSVRTNDFSNPLLDGYKSSTVFKSIQATLRLKKWPVLSAGYYPSSQVIKISDSKFQENLFYTFMASASHTYKVDGILMIGMLMYTQFYNKASDSGFVYFNTKNIYLSQSAFFRTITLQTQLSAAMNTSYSLYTIDNKVEVKISRWLSLGAGAKYNKQTVYNIDQWGYSGTALCKVPKIGEFRFIADKGFIPGSNRRLVENNVGRLTYLKVF